MQHPARLLILSFALIFAASGCPAKKPKYPTCSSEKDCRPGEKCVNKHCVKCAADKDCGPGQRCVEGACEPIEGWCSSDGDCPNGGVCKNNKCEPCKADAECGEGGRCRAGKCLRKGQCEKDEDCPEDEDCVRGVCTKAGDTSGTGGLPTCKLQTVYFDYDSSAVREDSKGALQSNAECLSTTPRAVAVVGLTDPRGTEEYNIALSDQRARAITDYLSRLGIDPARMRVVPKGEAEAAGTDEASWAKDRRVDFSWD